MIYVHSRKAEEEEEKSEEKYFDSKRLINGRRKAGPVLFLPKRPLKIRRIKNLYLPLLRSGCFTLRSTLYIAKKVFFAPSPLFTRQCGVFLIR